jgi:hypothetical protein
MSELREQLESEVKRIIEDPMPEIETDGVFDSAGYPMPQAGEFIDDPMAALMQPLIQYFESIKPKVFEPVKSEHKVKIFWLHRSLKIEEVEQIETMIEDLLNNGYCCHMPTVCSDFVIMDFSRRKESEENETQTKTP